MKKHFGKLFALFLSLIMLLLCLPLSSFAEDEKTTEEPETLAVNEIISSFNNPNGRVLCVASAGNPRSFPENSLEGIQSCIDMGVDIVEVDVRRTKDGQYVLMNDSDLSRMCVTKEGNEATARVSEETLDELKEYYVLKDGHGGENAKATKYKITSLAEAIETCKGKVMLMLDNSWGNADEINALVKSLDACDIVIFKDATTPESIESFISATGLPICHICAEFNPEASDSAKKYVSSALESGAETVLLSSVKSYASIFNKSVLNKFSDVGRAFISTTEPSLCGDREDRTSDWQDLIERGYSIIETDYPKELVSYIKSIENYRTSLSSLITQAQGVSASAYTTESSKALNDTLKEAEAISSKGAVSLDQIDLARYNLQEAIDNLTIRTEEEKQSLSGGIIALIIIACVIAVAIISIFTLRFINKKKSKNKSQPKPTSYNPPPEDDDSDFEKQ